MYYVRITIPFAVYKITCVCQTKQSKNADNVHCTEFIGLSLYLHRPFLHSLPPTATKLVESVELLIDHLHIIRFTLRIYF